MIVPINTATIRSEPSTQSETVAIFDQNQSLTVIGDNVPYYYQIEFCDPTTGNVKTGWVSK
ncbi:SH3 domain-containing protein [Acetobacterium wieringae]|uniref:SH3 domain-containing protein n=1 Tax=Acetobacterium wieringae TaxID=52694 RepID=UPI002B21E94C|nr:SH3 domain-containing protein [Acetobacterium wieringae]MEA4807398.1 SH3 domain-containing protein [Acetobacterium wieringae]